MLTYSQGAAIVAIGFIFTAFFAFMLNKRLKSFGETLRGIANKHAKDIGEIKGVIRGLHPTAFPETEQEQLAGLRNRAINRLKAAGLNHRNEALISAYMSLIEAEEIYGELS